MNLRIQLEKATYVPEIDSFAWLAANLAMTGVKIVPRQYWDYIAKWLCDPKKCDDLGEVDHGKFTYHNNHTLNNDHDFWQDDVFGKLAKENDEVWVIPVDELMCLHFNDKDACDFVTIERLSFIGTEKELAAEIDKVFAF